MPNEPIVQKIHHLPGTRLTPEVVLHRTLEKVPRIESILVVVRWDDGTVDSDWSQMKMSDLAFMLMSIRHKYDRMLDENMIKGPPELDLDR